MGFSFSQNAGEELVSIQNGDYRLSFALSQPNAAVSAAPELTAEKAEEKRSVRTAQGSEQVQGLAIEELEAPPCINSVVYEDAAPGTDIEYRLIGDRLQENLVIAQPGGAYEYDLMYQPWIDGTGRRGWQHYFLRAGRNGIYHPCALYV